MKIFQLILSNSISADLRYANEFYDGIHIYFPDIEIYKHTIGNNQTISYETIKLINSCDYLFIYNLENNKNHYNVLLSYITTKKILFITNQNVKRFVSKINTEYIKDLLLSCHKIVLNKNINALYNKIIELSHNQLMDSKIIQLDYIYNPDYSVIDIPKQNEIVQISNKGLNSKYDLFIKLFENKKDYFKDFIWKIYGCEKNIQTLSIDKLFIDKATNEKSSITNTDTNVIDKDKINIYQMVYNDKLKDILHNIYFACCFDNFDFINYTILDIIYSGVIPVFNKKYAKNIKVNNKQSIGDIINAIYIDDDNPINEIIEINKYIKSSSTHKALAERNIKICNQLFNPQTNIKKLIQYIENE